MLAVYVLSCILLVLTFQGLHIWPRTTEMTRELRAGFGVMASKQLSDDEKEVALRNGSLRVLGLTAKLTLALVVVFAAATAPVAIAVWAGWMSWTGFLMFTIEPIVVIGTVAALGAYPRLQSWVRARFAAQAANG